MLVQKVMSHQAMLQRHRETEACSSIFISADTASEYIDVTVKLSPVIHLNFCEILILLITQKTPQQGPEHCLRVEQLLQTSRWHSTSCTSLLMMGECQPKKTLISPSEITQIRAHSEQETEYMYCTLTPKFRPLLRPHPRSTSISSSSAAHRQHLALLWPCSSLPLPPP